MVDNQHKLITGYRDLSQDEINVINSIKQAEADLGKLISDLTYAYKGDPRWRAIAKTHFEEGFSALVRSIAKPESPFS